MTKFLKLGVPVVLLPAVLLIIAALYFAQGDGTPVTEAVAAEPIDFSADMTLGAEDAPVTVIEYASMSCNHCALFHSSTFPDLKKNYIDTGKVQLIFREFPINRPALEAAMVARCAGPKKFFTFLKFLFAKQSTWAVEDSRGELATVARLGGMNVSTVAQCLDNKELRESILETRMQGEKEFDVTSTPTFIVNGNKYAGALSFEQFEKVLTPLLPTE
jgi:protein-disulfide isomerase